MRVWARHARRCEAARKAALPRRQELSASPSHRRQRRLFLLCARALL